MRKTVAMQLSGRKMNSRSLEIGDGQMHVCRERMSAVLRRALYQLLRWRRKCGATAVTGSVQRGKIAALRYSSKSKCCTSMINLSDQLSECLVSGSWDCNGSCTIRVRRAVVDRSRQISVILI